jgi:predicted metal-dependent hydrolase
MVTIRHKQTFEKGELYVSVSFYRNADSTFKYKNKYGYSYIEGLVAYDGSRIIKRKQAAQAGPEADTGALLNTLVQQMNKEIEELQEKKQQDREMEQAAQNVFGGSALDDISEVAETLYKLEES